jgi:hypothetical protein
MLLAGGLLAVTVVGAVGWYLAAPLFIDNVVNEEFVFEASAEAPVESESTAAEVAPADVEVQPSEPVQPESTAPEAGSVEIPDEDELAQMTEVELKAKELELLEVAATMQDKVMDDPMPKGAPAGPTVVIHGMFQDADNFHQGSGTATIFQLPDGSNVLRLEDFEVTNGPDLHVLLVEHPDPTSSEQVMDGYLDLGSLKGNIGNQNYDIPAGTDLSKYNTVVIYCVPFHVVFSTASLG